LEDDFRASGARALVPREDADAVSGLRLDHPLDERPLSCRVVGHPPDDLTPFDAAAELAGLLARFPARDPRAVGQLEVDLDGAHGFPFESLLADVRREPAFVLEHEP